MEYDEQGIVFMMNIDITMIRFQATVNVTISPFVVEWFRK